MDAGEVQGDAGDAESPGEICLEMRHLSQETPHTLQRRRISRTSPQGDATSTALTYPSISR